MTDASKNTNSEDSSDDTQTPNVVCRCQTEGKETRECKLGYQHLEARETALETKGPEVRYSQKLGEEANKGTSDHNAEQPSAMQKGTFIPPDNYKGHKMARLYQVHGCPYVRITLVGHAIRALIDSGAGISIISQQTAEKIIQTDRWKEEESQGTAKYDTSVSVAVVSCIGDDIEIRGQIILPDMDIETVTLPVQASFWVMEVNMDDVIIVNKWLTTQMQALLAWWEELNTKVLYYKIPTTPLKAGGIPIKANEGKTELTTKTQTQPKKQGMAPNWRDEIDEATKDDSQERQTEEELTRSTTSSEIQPRAVRPG